MRLWYEWITNKKSRTRRLILHIEASMEVDEFFLMNQEIDPEPSMRNELHRRVMVEMQEQWKVLPV